MGEAEEGPIASEAERKKEIPTAQGARQESDDLRRSIDLLNDAYAAVERALGACMNRQALEELQSAEELLELAIAHVKGSKK
jgi:hypothetical protein